MKPSKKPSADFIYTNYQISLNDLKKIKFFFWFSGFLFLLVFFIGALFPVFFEEKILELIKSLIDQTEEFNVIELIQFIIFNNTRTAFLGMILGIILGVFPLSILIINAYILGFVANKTIISEGLFILWRLLPHGIFEIPAILISLALGLKLGIDLMKNSLLYYNKKANPLMLSTLIIISMLIFPIAFFIYLIITFKEKKLRKTFYNNLVLSLRIFLLIIIPLLVVAGFIEGLLIFLIG